MKLKLPLIASAYLMSALSAYAVSVFSELTERQEAQTALWVQKERPTQFRRSLGRAR